MRTLISRAAGLVVGAVLSLSAGSVLAQELFKSDPVLLQFERDVRSTYIVRLSGDLPAQAVNNRANEIALRFGGRVRSVYTNSINGFAITMPSIAFANMIRARGLDIVSVERDQIATIVGKGDTPAVAGPPEGKGPKPKVEEPETSSCDQEIPWGVNRVTGLSLNSDTCVVTDVGVGENGGDVESPSYDSAEDRVCVIDTGVDFDHPDLNVHTEFFNFTTDKDDDDLNGHGTHVAGTIGADANNETGVVGVAPGASIVSVKVLNRRGSGRYSDVIAGIDAAADMSSGGPICTVANMSLGGPKSISLDRAVICASDIDEAAANSFDCSASVQVDPAGITFTLAAGNSGVDASDYSPANVGEFSDNIHTIAAMDSGDGWAYFSNFGDPVDYIEPGLSIKSTFKDGSYKTYSGTSMAAPHMAGLVLRDLVNNATFETDGKVQRGSAESYDIAVDENYTPPLSAN